MKRSVKIVLLAIAVIAAIAAVLVYMRTIVSPPDATKMHDQYAQALKQHLVDYDGAEFAPDDIDALLDRVTRFRDENAITADDAQKAAADFTRAYAPRFAAWRMGRFERPVWLDDDHKMMLNRINDLRSNALTAPTLAQMTSTNDSLSQVVNIINRYHRARSAARQATFYTVDDARQRIAEARKYLNDTTLRHCTALAEQLRTVPARIGKSHYASLRSYVNICGVYTGITQAEFENRLRQANSKIREYNNNADKLYGSHQSTAHLSNTLARYQSQGNQYFAQKY